MTKMNKYQVLLITLLILQLHAADSYGQAPENSFYHNETTILPYASFLVTLPDGEVTTVPFTPILIVNSPAGTEFYSKDIDIRGRLVFAGNGIVAPDAQLNSYGDYNLQGQIPIIVYNVPDDYKTRYGVKSDLHIRIQEAVTRGASAVIVFGIPGNPGWNSPLITLPNTEPSIDVPVISISYDNAISLLNKLGLNIKSLEDSRDYVLSLNPIELPCIARITINSKLSQAVSSKFSLSYLPGILTEEMMKEYLSNKERAFNLVSQYLDMHIENVNTSEEIFFPDLTSMKYFTGIEDYSPEGFGKVFMVFRAYKPNSYPLVYGFGDIVHEMTYHLLADSWKNSHPALMEGLGVMLKDVVNSDETSLLDKRAADLLKQDKMVPVIEILTNDSLNFFNFTPDASTELGSFIRYIYNAFGRAKFKRLYDKYKTESEAIDRVRYFIDVYFKEYRSLEYEWLEIIALKHGVPTKNVDGLLLKSENYVKLIKAGKIK